MQNTGTWDSDLAILFLGCLLLPISMYFLRGFFEAIAAARPIIIVRPPLEKAPAKNTYKPPQVVEFTASETWAESVDRHNKPSKQRASKPKKKAAPKAAPKTVAPLTSETIEAEAISALCNMGYKKGEASKLVKSLSSKTKYDSAESLIKGCFMCIS